MNRIVALGCTALVACGAALPDTTGDDAAAPSAPASDASVPVLDATATSSAPHVPVPRSGGVLLVLGEGRVALSDPDHDRVRVITLPHDVLEVPVPPGSEPGRIVADGAGRLHVVLRAGRGIVTLDPVSGATTVRPVCAAPRGIAWRSDDDMLLVACAEGGLFRMHVRPTAVPELVAWLDDDLRDVVWTGASIYVSRFRSAEVIRLDRAYREVARYRPATVERPDLLSSSPGATATFTPSVAWRLIATRDGGAMLLHQRGRVTPVPAASAAALSVDPGAVEYVGRAAHDCVFPLVESAISVIAPDAPPGELPPTGALPVALARDIAEGLPYVADAGRVGPTCETGGLVGVASGAIHSIGYTPHGWLVRASDSVIYVEAGFTAYTEDVAIGAAIDSPRDVVETLTPSALACISCHPDGGDDGRVWAIGDRAPVRTPAMRGHVLDTAPYDWEGDLATMPAFLDAVLVHRMGGTALSADDADAFGRWLDGLDPPPRPVSDAHAVARGRSLFVRDDVGCVGCHAGEHATNGATLDLGTGGAFQVPQLVGVAYRAPYMHDGCARTLRERFTGDPDCTGGDAHGHTSALSSAQIDDLVAYLRSL